MTAIIAICAGACLGSCLRWGLGLWLNHLLVSVALGTLVANIAGGLLMGVAMGIFAILPHPNPHLPLFVLTGFLGSLTTFSAFSAEVVTHLREGHASWALMTLSSHVLGSLLATFIGLIAVNVIRQATLSLSL